MPARWVAGSGTGSIIRRSSSSCYRAWGDDWDVVHAEAIARLDRAEPIFWMVARSEAERKPFVRMGESAYYSGLFVDDGNRLRRVDPALSVEQMEPGCACCTHTFNGVPFTRKYRPPAD